MEESRSGQVAFGWAGEGAAGGTERPEPEARHAAPRPPRRTRAASAEAPLPPDDELWDVQDAARFLKRSVSWVYHRVEDGTLPVKRLAGWGVRFIPAELRAWVEGGGGSRR
ncbi:MAG TPA: helix-turn-helix domain-containing protein [Anaeromyxobacteraceae bacterium]|nr:helix-turn-helix domain-containing protein [Anaeromyxobacteraceae bacterium]